jgi:ABC-type uncharacterized transport system permease subunit
MSIKHATHVAVCAAIIAFSLALALPAFVAIPVAWYRPVEHAWTFAVHADGVAMDFYGRCAFAAIASIVVAVAAYSIARRARRELSRDGAAIAAVWAIAIVVIAMGFFTWRQLHRQFTPPHERPIPVAIIDD